MLKESNLKLRHHVELEVEEVLAKENNRIRKEMKKLKSKMKKKKKKKKRNFKEEEKRRKLKEGVLAHKRDVTVFMVNSIYDAL